MIDIDTLELARYLATCHTAGCENEGIALDILAAAVGPVVLCGPCMAVIEDVVAFPEGEPLPDPTPAPVPDKEPYA
jgi:hypothetical protein